MQDERGDTEYDHEETDFKKTEAGVFPELEIEEWTGGSPWKSSSLSEINHDHNRDLLVSIKRPREKGKETLINPAIRKDHLNPMLGSANNRLIKIGQTTPPMEDPEYNIPMAIALLFLNQ